MPSSVKKNPDLERAYKFLLGMNFLFAILIISWIPRLSEVKKLLGLNNEVFGSLMGLGSIGSLVAYGSSGYVIERFGSKRVINISIVLLYFFIAQLNSLPLEILKWVRNLILV
ncbi:MAG: hypothetical protein NTV47_06320 [Actinobacteria bacterium]|nr:hypothetical protein [Actinomycetota bacterium]